MTFSSVVSTSVVFPRSPTTWYFLPQRNKRSSPPLKRDPRIQKVDIPSEDMTGNSEAASPVPTGVEHWEEQRRKWTKGFAERVNQGNDDVDYPKIV